MNFRAFLFVAVALGSLGCASTPPIDKQAHEAELSPLQIAAAMQVKLGTPIISVDEGNIVKEPDPLPSDFGDSVVMAVSRTYYLDGKTLESKFEILFVGVDPTYKSTAIKDNVEIGKAKQEEVYLLARSKDLDPFLVSCSNTKPTKANGYWYYTPGMYISKEMKWLLFEPAPIKKLKQMYDDVADPKNHSTSSELNWWILVETKLDAYPVPITVDGGEAYDQLISFKGVPLRLTYQKGFLKYLTDEYKLGDPIYLYLQLTLVNAETKEIDCYVRDFSLVPPKQIVEERMQKLK